MKTVTMVGAGCLVGGSLVWAYLWELPLVAEGIEAGRLGETDRLRWFGVWLVTVAARLLALVVLLRAAWEADSEAER